MTNNTTASQDGPVFQPQRIFVKESHFTSPELPQVLKVQQGYRQRFEVAVSFNALEEDLHEVCLKLTVHGYPQQDNTSEAGSDQPTAVDDADVVPVYTTIVEQSGVFLIKGFDETQSAGIKKVTCAEMLFPFAVAHTVTLVTQAGFPPVYLSPINFHAVNAQAQEKQAQQVQMSQGSKDTSTRH